MADDAESRMPIVEMSDCDLISDRYVTYVIKRNIAQRTSIFGILGFRSYLIYTYRSMNYELWQL
jgi:hypothetical protein